MPGPAPGGPDDRDFGGPGGSAHGGAAPGSGGSGPGERGSAPGPVDGGGPAGGRSGGPSRSSSPPPAGADGWDNAVPNAPDELPPEYFAQLGDASPAGDGDVHVAGDPGWSGGYEGGGRNGPRGRDARNGRDGRGQSGRGRGGPARNGGGRGGRWGGPPPPRIDPLASAERRRAAVEVLRHAVHDPASVGQFLDEALFDEPAHVAVFRALVEHDTHAAAVAALHDQPSALLSRLLVEEPTHDALDSLCQLLRTVVWRELRMLNVGTADDPESVLRDTMLLNGVLTDLDHRRPDAANEAAGRLLAWLRLRVGDGG